MINEKFSVDGYVFETEEEYNEALNEKKGVDYMRSRTNLNNIVSVQEVYDKVLEKNIFKTPIGYNFMRELQNILVKSSLVDNSEIKNIKVDKKGDKNAMESNKQLKNQLKNIESIYKNRFFNSVILNIALVILIIVLMIITMNSKNANVLNYKNRIDAEYNSKVNDLAAWEEELDEREELLEGQENAN